MPLNNNQSRWKSGREAKRSGNAARPSCGGGRARAFTYLEVMMVLMILGIMSTMALGTFSRVEGAQRAGRAAREFIAAQLYARTMTMSTGVTYGVQTNTKSNLFLVYKTGLSPVPFPLGQGGNYSVPLSSTSEILGVTMTPTPAPDTNGLTSYPYNALGTCTNTGNVIFTFGDQKSTVVIPAVGDPYIQ